MMSSWRATVSSAIHEPNALTDANTTEDNFYNAQQTSFFLSVTQNCSHFTLQMFGKGPAIKWIAYN